MLRHVLAMTRRCFVGHIRQPSQWAFGSAFPLLIAAVNAAAYSKSTELPDFGFEVDSFLDFLVPATIVQGAVFLSINAGSELALDIEGGFFDRLVMSPVTRSSILLGRVLAAGMLAAAQAALYLGVFTIFGASVKGGPLAVLTLLLMAGCLGAAVGLIGCIIALRSGSAETVQATFPMFFVLLFFSSAFFPISLMAGWFAQFARNNPLTWMIDAARRLVLVEFTISDAATALAVPLVVGALLLGLGVRALNARADL